MFPHFFRVHIRTICMSWTTPCIPRSRPSIYHKSHIGTEFDTHALLFSTIFCIFRTGHGRFGSIYRIHSAASAARRRDSSFVYCVPQQKLGRSTTPFGSAFWPHSFETLACRYDLTTLHCLIFVVGLGMSDQRNRSLVCSK